MKALIAGTTLCVLSAWAVQSVAGPCDAVVETQDVLVLDAADEFSLARLESVDRQQYENSKHDASGGATIPIKGVPVNFDFSYDDAKALARIERESRKLDITHNQYLSMKKSYLTEMRADAWVKCLQAENPYVEVLAPSSALKRDNREFILTIKYHEPRNDKEVPFGKVSGTKKYLITGGEVVAPFPDVIRNDGEVLVRVKRDPSKDFQFAVVVNGMKGEVGLPPAGTQSQVKYEIVASKEAFVQTGQINNYADQQKDVCVEVPAGSTAILFPSTARPVDLLWSAEDRGRTNSFVLGVPAPKDFKTNCGGGPLIDPMQIAPAATSKQVCMRVCSHVSHRGVGAAIKSELRVLLATPAP